MTFLLWAGTQVVTDNQHRDRTIRIGQGLSAPWHLARTTNQSLKYHEYGFILDDPLQLIFQ